MVTRKWIILGTLVVSLLFAGVALGSGTPSIDRWVIGGGGGSVAVGGISLDGTIGQWVVGSDKSGTIELGHGFWGGGWDERYAIYLPLVLMNYP